MSFYFCIKFLKTVYATNFINFYLHGFCFYYVIIFKHKISPLFTSSHISVFFYPSTTFMWFKVIHGSCGCFAYIVISCDEIFTFITIMYIIVCKEISDCCSLRQKMQKDRKIVSSLKLYLCT